MDEPRDGSTEGEAERLRRIEEELERVRKTTQFASPDDPDIERRLQAIEEKAKGARRLHDEHVFGRKPKSMLDAESTRGLGVGLTIAYAIIGVPLVGFGAGWLLDRAMGGGTLWQALGTVFGAVAAIAYAVKVTSRD